MKHESDRNMRTLDKRRDRAFNVVSDRRLQSVFDVIRHPGKAHIAGIARSLVLHDQVRVISTFEPRHWSAARFAGGSLTCGR
ncbi:hypothetical protein A5704_06075 [Mycobacterium sp. E735]|nr:hypothetical protein A5704_06075 [Mycobacterium sp. E735]